MTTLIDRPDVIALHCSGASGAQWRRLAENLGPDYRFHAPDFFGSGDAGPWPGARAFTLAEEAAPIIDLIDRGDRPVFLVGHSYGGGVALHIAAARPDRIVGLALYEPSAFHLLRTAGPSAAAAFDEIRAVSRGCDGHVLVGDLNAAAAGFVDYWNGPGAWTGLKSGTRAALMRWIGKAPLEFRALIDETTVPEAYRNITCPTLILRGGLAPAPTRAVAARLAALLPNNRCAVVKGAGHMGPISHADAVSARIAAQIRRTGAPVAAVPANNNDPVPPTGVRLDPAVAAGPWRQPWTW